MFVFRISQKRSIAFDDVDESFVRSRFFTRSFCFHVGFHVQQSRTNECNAFLRYVRFYGQNQVAANVKPSRVVRQPLPLERKTMGRREAFGLLASGKNGALNHKRWGLVLGGMALVGTMEAEAIEIPFKESIRRKDEIASTEASMAAYDMEGIKKTRLSSKERKKLLEKVRERALAGNK